MSLCSEALFVAFLTSLISCLCMILLQAVSAEKQMERYIK